MIRHWIYEIVMLLLVACNRGDQTSVNENNLQKKQSAFAVSPDQQVDTIALNKTDTAFIVRNKLIADDMGDRYKSYLIHIHFNNKKWPSLTFKNAIGADLALMGDLDGDQQPELLLRPAWFSSCWASINLFSLKGNSWQLVKNGSMYFCSNQYPLNKRIVKTEKGYGLLTDSLADDKFITLKKMIKF